VDQEAISIEVGSYEWRDMDFTVPALPAEVDRVMVMDSAKVLAATAVAATVALTLF
jgi:hypothetical protein